MDFYTQRGDIFLLELSRQVSLDECCLTDTSVAHKNEFEFWYVLLRLLNHNDINDKIPEDGKKEKRKSTMSERVMEVQ